MVTIQFLYNNRVINGVLLAKYQRPHDEVYSVKKEFLGKTKITYEHRTLNTPLYVIFIPWRHKEKEIIEVDEKFIINPENVGIDETWISIDKFTSERTESFNNHSWSESVEVSNFCGYKFMYDNNSFMINLCMHEYWETLTILFQNIPQLLDIDLKNEEFG